MNHFKQYINLSSQALKKIENCSQAENPDPEDFQPAIKEVSLMRSSRPFAHSPGEKTAGERSVSAFPSVGHLLGLLGKVAASRLRREVGIELRSFAWQSCEFCL